MADKAQQRGVTIAAGCCCSLFDGPVFFTREVFAVANQGSGIAVLQAAIAFVNRIEHEQVGAVRHRPPGLLGGLARVPKFDGCLANFLGVGQQAGTVETRWCAGHHKAVRQAARLEGAAPEPAQLNRAVDQLVVVSGLVAAKAVAVGFNNWQASGSLPGCRPLGCDQVQPVGQVFLAMDL